MHMAIACPAGLVCYICPIIIHVSLLLQVNAITQGKAALHCASVAGNIPVLKAILEFNPDLEIEVCEISCSC